MATIASEGLTPEAVWAGLRRNWLMTEALGNRAWSLGGGNVFDKAASPERTNQAINQQWFEQVSNRRNQLENHFRCHPPKLHAHTPQRSVAGRSRSLVLINETHPPDVLASFLAAALAGWNMALANPRWGTQEWQSLSQLISPNVIWGQDNSLIEPTRLAENPVATDGPAILIPTGGSSGQVKLAHHTWDSLMASVTGFHQHFAPNNEPINTYCVLPVHHVSGLMQVLRSWTSNGQVILTPFKTLETTPLPQWLSVVVTPKARQSQGANEVMPQAAKASPQALAPFISLVPTQLHRLLQANKGPWLSQFQAVLLGGAPPWPKLLVRATQHRIPLYLSYGMTETAAMVTAFNPKPLELQADQLSSGQTLPHATIEIVKDGHRLAPGEMGQVVVHSDAIAQGYYPPSGHTSKHPSGHISRQQPSANFSPGTFYTDDLGYLSTDGYLYITGRTNRKIISGGENIFPAEVEAALRGTDLVKDICVIGQPHEIWGEVVTAIYVPAHKNVSPQQLKQALSAPATHNAPTLSRYKHPKRWISLETLPRNEQGKLNRAQLLNLIQTSAKSASQPNSSAVNG